MGASSVVKQPTYAGSSLAVLAAACVTGVLASQPVQVSIAGIGAVGAFLLLGSGHIRRHGHRVLGGGFVFAGSGLICLALGLSLLSQSGLFERTAFFGGILAMACVVLGVFPLRQSWAGSLVWLGIVLFSCSLVFLVWVSDPGRMQLLLGFSLTIITWDMAEHAIVLGNDVGRSARTYPVTVVHFMGSLGVGLVAGIVALMVDSVQLPAIPIAALALLLGAILLSLLVLFLGESEWLSGT